MFLSKLLILCKIKYALIFLCFYGFTTSWAFEFSYDDYDGETALRKSMLKHSDSLYTPVRGVKTYGPVKKNEIIWNIANNLRPDESISTVHMIIAIFKQNPDAFHNNNLNNLLSGVTLIVPDMTQINQLSKTEVDKIYLQHKQRWQQTATGTSKLPTKIGKNQELKKVADLIKAIKANDQQMSNNQKKIARHEEVMGNIEGLLDNIETKYANKKPQTSEKMTDSGQIQMLPKTIEEVTKPVVDMKTDKANDQQMSNNQKKIARQEAVMGNFETKSANKKPQTPEKMTDSGQIQMLPKTIEEVTKPVVDMKTEIKPEFSDVSSQNKSNSSQNSFKTMQTPELNTQSERLDIDVKNRSISHQAFIIISLMLLVLLYLFKHYKFKLMKEKEDAPLFQQEIEESELIKEIDSSNTNNVLDKQEQLTQSSHQKHRASIIESAVQKHSLITEDENTTSREAAFFIATHPEKLTYKTFVKEFEHITYNKNINVFVDEFERLIPKLTEQIQNMSNDGYGLEILHEFRSSLKSIIKLSDMIQAPHLNNLTKTVFELLDDMVNENIKISEKIFRRLLLVVGFYNRYVHLIKINRYYQANFTNRK